MRYLILTGKFGMGHLSAASAIKQRLEAEDPGAEVYLADMLETLFPSVSNLIYKAFGLLVRRCCRIYNYFYGAAERYCNISIPAQHTLACKVQRLLAQFEPDVVISTLPLCSKLMSVYKDQTGSVLPLVTCITDVCTHSEWICPHTDRYLAASASVKRELELQGVDPKNIYITGIPVKREFHPSEEVNSSAKKNVLIMGGGLGLMPDASGVLTELDQRSDVNAVMITGKNEKAFRRMTETYPHIKVLGYVDNVQEYMAAADLIFTKPGGITLFEAIHAGVPLFVMNPFLGQEMANARYIEREQIGVVVRGTEAECIKALRAMLYSEESRKQMKANMAKICKGFAAYNLSRILQGAERKEVAACMQSF